MGRALKVVGGSDTLEPGTGSGVVSLFNMRPSPWCGHSSLPTKPGSVGHRGQDRPIQSVELGMEEIGTHRGGKTMARYRQMGVGARGGRSCNNQATHHGACSQQPQ